MKIKVFHVITMLELGGAQQNTLYTVSHLDKNRFDTALVCGKGGMLDPQAFDSGVRVHFIPDLVCPVNPLRDVMALFELLALFRKERPDIVHTHSSKAGILARLAAFFAGVPVIIHSFHGFGFHNGQPWPLRRTFQIAEKVCAALSHALVFVSRANMDTARRLGIGDQGSYRIIRSGIVLNDYPASTDPAAKRSELGLPPAGPVVVSVGNLKPQKNPADFVRVAEIVLRELPQACFLFVGDGILRGKIDEMTRRLGIAKRCVFAGWRKDIAEILSMSDVFVLTSLWEGLPRSLVEAIKCRVPCVCYGTDGVRDIISDGKNGFLVEPEDIRSMSEKICRILRDKDLRERLIHGCLLTELKEFDIVSMVSSQEKLYETLLKPDHSRS